MQIVNLTTDQIAARAQAIIPGASSPSNPWYDWARVLLSAVILHAQNNKKGDEEVTRFLDCAEPGELAACINASPWRIGAFHRNQILAVKVIASENWRSRKQ